MEWLLLGALTELCIDEPMMCLFREKSFERTQCNCFPLGFVKYFVDKVGDQQLSFRRTRRGDRECKIGRALFAAFIAI